MALTEQSPRLAPPLGMSETYWAAEGPDEVAEYLTTKISDYHSFVEHSGRADLWRRAYQLFYGMDADLGWSNSAAVSYGGVQGELTLLRVNLLRALVEDLLILTAGERPSFHARAINADYQSQAQTELAEGLVHYYLVEKRFENAVRDALECALLFGEGWLKLGWDAHEGQAYGVEPVASGDGDLLEERIVKAGDATLHFFSPIDVVRDVASDIGNHRWHMVHSRRSKWDLAARYTEFRDHIINETSTPRYIDRYLYPRTHRDAPDEISIYEFFHERTDALPDGRYMLLVGGRAIVDDVLPYADYPLIPIIPAPEQNSAFGYSRVWDLMALQESIDSIASNLMSNHDAFGLPNVWTPKGSDLTVQDLAGGLSHLESTDKPEVVDLLRMNDGSFKLLDTWRELMTELSGLNNVVRGKSEEGIRSAQHAALMYSQAAQATSRIQQSWLEALEKCSTRLIRILQQYAKAPHIAEITGNKSKPLLREFVGTDIAAVQKVTVDLGNPMMRQAEGRMSIAEMLVQLSNTRGQEPITPDQLMQVLLSGKLDPISERPNSQRRLCALENEKLLNGEAPPVLITDVHEQHIREHLPILDEPTVRLDQTRMGAAQQHIQEHIRLWVSADPNILKASGQNPPMVPPGVAGAMAGGAPPGEKGPPKPPGVNPGIEDIPSTDMPSAPGPVEEAGVKVPEPPPV